MFWVSRHIFHLAVKMSHCRIHGAFYFEVSTLYLSLGRQCLSTGNVLSEYTYISFTWQAECLTAEYMEHFTFRWVHYTFHLACRVSHYRGCFGWVRISFNWQAECLTAMECLRWICISFTLQAECLAAEYVEGFNSFRWAYISFIWQASRVSQYRKCFGWVLRQALTLTTVPLTEILIFHLGSLSHFGKCFGWVLIVIQALIWHCVGDADLSLGDLSLWEMF